MDDKLKVCRNFKRYISILLSVVLLFSLCSCGLFHVDEKDIRQQQYKDMREYLNNNTSLNIKQIRDSEYNEDLKSVLLDVDLPFKAQVSLKQLDELRIAMTEYLQQDGKYLAEGWQVAVDICDDAGSSGEGKRYARFANFEKGYLYHYCLERYETADYLNTFHFLFASEDISYISSLTNVEYMYIAGYYSETDTELMNRTIEEISKLDNLKKLKINKNWYEGFLNADLGCEIEEETSYQII